MTTYTVSWFSKIGNEWKRCHSTFDSPVEPTYEEVCNLIDHTPGQSDPYCVQLEVGDPAVPYVPRKHKGKNTNAWKPRRYGA
jgi:hypothetical protein